MKIISSNIQFRKKSQILEYTLPLILLLFLVQETDPEYRVKVCASAFQDHRHPTQFWTFGDIFFRSHYVEFDSGRNRIGIAHSKTSVDF